MSDANLRLSLSAHYTSYVWFKYHLSYPELTTVAGRIAHLLLMPINSVFKLKGGVNIDTFLLQRHQLINQQIQYLVEQQGVTQILELAAGLSPRGIQISRRYPHVHYIESDVPSMQAHKSKLLNKLVKPHNLESIPCFFMAQKQQANISQALSLFKQTEPTLVISEGLINYFTQTQLQQGFKQISQALSCFKQGTYLTDLYPDNQQHPYYAYAKFAQNTVAWLTNSNWQLQYTDTQAIKQAFSQANFQQTQVLTPTSNNLKKPNMTPFVRIVLAKT